MHLFKDKNLAFQWFEKEKIIIFPTETVYGLGACAFDENGVKKIFELKNRPLENPLIIHFSSIEQVEKYCEINSLELTLLNIFTPGPLTLLLKKKNINFFTLATNNSDYICARIPQGEFIKELINKFGPISGPSANLSGQLTLTKEPMIENSYKYFNIGAYIDDNLVRGIESTIVQVVEGEIHILRKGLIDKSKLEIYGSVIYNKKKTLKVPGTKFLHYQTIKPLRIYNKKKIENFHIDMGDNECDFNLSRTYNIEEIYNNYFYSLYLGDQSSLANITINNLPNGVEFDSLRDRLEKSLLKNEKICYN